MWKRTTDNNMPRISIIIPNHNYGQYIADAILSVKSQTLRDWECFIIDDASTDDSVAVIKKLIRGDKRFKLIQFSEPVGASRARNAGMDAATGDYIAFLDSDDCYTEYALEMLLNLAVSMDAQIAGAQTLIVPHDFKYTPTNKNKDWSVGRSWIEENPARFLMAPKQYNWCWVWRRIYRRDLIENIRFVPEFTGAGDDIAFMMDLCHQTKRIVETETISVYHRLHNASVMHRGFDESAFQFFPILFRHMRENVCDKYPAGYLRAFYRNLFDYMINRTIITPKQTGQCKDSARQTVIAACKLIPRRYLPLRRRVLCWFLSCLK